MTLPSSATLRLGGWDSGICQASALITAIRGLGKLMKPHPGGRSGHHHPGVALCPAVRKRYRLTALPADSASRPSTSASLVTGSRWIDPEPSVCEPEVNRGGLPLVLFGMVDLVCILETARI